MTKPPVVIVPHDSQWPRLFQAESGLIRKQIGSYLEALEHVGSTAVPGLAAKPIIDIMPGLRQLSDAQGCIKPLAAIGYEYVPEYEDELPERRYFRKGPPEGRTHHVHLVETATEFWHRQLLFRDYLRTHPDTAEAYEALKHRLARKDLTDRDAYTDGKTPFIEAVIEEARGEAARGTP
ncbi:MAG: GrpB family protein [Candidatus Thermoplasmatota archaeon]|nr:GrpB family protein [Candidatus Thermoplasmatota archaeon]